MLTLTMYVSEAGIPWEARPEPRQSSPVAAARRQSNKHGKFDLAGRRGASDGVYVPRAYADATRTQLND
jgi:hypothetical protein